MCGSLAAAFFILIPLAAQPLVRVERVPVDQGGELYTYFYAADHGSVPLVSIMRDTLGDADPANDRLRFVWSFGYERPSLGQRIMAAVPFLYRRAGREGSSTAAAKPMLDLAAPAQGTVPKLIAAALQSSVIDPLGIAYRAASRSYRGRSGEYRAMHTWRTVQVLRTAAAGAGGLTDDELALVQGRLVLSNRMLGGLVSDQAAPAAWSKRQHASALNRGHNWELLRQRAEDNGLFFQPLAIDGFALLWMEQGSLDPGEGKTFDRKFLNIADPFHDERLRHWDGYSEIWPSGARMIPLALYALDYPRVPLLLVDFRDSGKPHRREIVSRMGDDLTTGVLGLTGFGNWPYLLAKQTWFFVHGRYGSPTDRGARVRSYVELRQALLMDRTLNPALRAELSRRAERLGLNAFEEGWRREVQIARAQYSALLTSADRKLGGELQRERQREACVLLHSTPQRLGFRMASLATLGAYRHHDQLSPERLLLVDSRRREGRQAPPPETKAISAGGQ